MKVTLQKQGGLAGGFEWPHQVVDSSNLPGSAASDLEQLAAAVKSAPVVDDASRARARDSMTFTITIDDNSAEPTVVEQPDTAMSATFAALVDWLERYAASE